VKQQNVYNDRREQSQRERYVAIDQEQNGGKHLKRCQHHHITRDKSCFALLGRLL
jgi:hypothetical protein